MKLSELSVKWALNHIKKFNDTDLFPIPKEFELIWENINDFVAIIIEIDLGSHVWGSSRRFIVPKQELSYRTVTQLSPIDSVLFAGIIFEIGSKIEAKRHRQEENKIFTYRFEPDDEGHLFKKESAWTPFWKRALELTENYSHVTYLDIADFYNQIYHHTIENQLGECEIENQYIKAILNLLKSLTQKVSRGIPIGPYPAHLLAELSLIPIDQSLNLRGFEFIRYADDFLIFTNSEQEAKAAIYEFASILDREQRIAVQTQKTKIYDKAEFIQYAKNKIADEPLNESEKELIDLIKSKTGNDPYAKTNIYSLTAAELDLVSDGSVEELMKSYLALEEIDFVRIRWIYKRLGQIGIPNLVDFSVANFEKLLPAVNDICHYLLSTSDNYLGGWENIGEEALVLLDLPIVESNAYFQIAIINLFSSNVEMNHFDQLLRIYRNSSEAIKRKIILMASEMEAIPWIREQKETIGQMNLWTKRAYYLAMKNLPRDERKFLAQALKGGLSEKDVLDKFILNHLN